MKRIVSGIMLTILLMGTLYTLLDLKPVAGWSNGGYSSDPSNPNYGTHDWIAQHALDWLSNAEKEYIVNNLAIYLYGTELPDNSGAPDGIGDTALHHVYYWSNESLQDDASATRAQTEYSIALSYIKSGNVAIGAKTLGIMSHYVVDVGEFEHVMGSGTEWGSEVHHSDYETYVDERTNSYDAEFNAYLAFDGSLDKISAYDAACTLAYDTTFDVDGNSTCVWMDQNYDWSNQTFKDRCGESLNLAVNALADVLHTFCTEARAQETRIFTDPPSVTKDLPLGDVFSIDVKIENIPDNQGLVGLQFQVSWNSSILEGVSMQEVLFTSVTPPGGASIWVIWLSASGGEAKYAVTWLDLNKVLAGGYAPIYGNHTVATIQLRVKGYGITTIDLFDTKLGDQNAQPITHESEDGLIQILPVVPATLDVYPQALNLRGKGNWTTVYIETETGNASSARDIVLTSVRLNHTIAVDPSAPTVIGDYDNDNVTDLMVNFNRTIVSEFILSMGITSGNVSFILTGELTDGTLFGGNSVIRVKMPGDLNMDNTVNMKDVSIAVGAFNSFPNHPRWDWAADEVEDGRIDTRDILAVLLNFGRHY